DENEHTEGVCAIGYALRDVGGDIYAVSIPVPSTRYPRVKDRLAEVMARHMTSIGP
ncbi:IclR family transcriptional regulator C-terminal domain-containing protein, partial [Tateyamaria sp.]